MNIIQPAALKRGDAIGIVAPASPFDRTGFEKGVRLIAARGFTPVFTDNLFQTKGYFAGSDAHRARELEAYYRDPAVRAVWCARGGYGTMRILSLLDYAAIARNPKPLVGCSDITALLNTICQRCGIVTIHGPMVASLEQADAATQSAIFECLTKANPTDISIPDGAVIRAGKASGPLAGGNLATLCHLLQTPFAPDFSGRIVFLEDTGEKPYRIDRMLFQMKLAGCFSSVAGICLGTFENCGDISEIHRIAEDILSDIPVPVLAGLPIGHGMPNLPLPIGVAATLDTEARRLTCRASAVKLP